MKVTAIVAKAFFLRRHPEFSDAFIPHLPVYKTAITEYVVATLAREIRKHLRNQQLAAGLEETARLLVERSSKILPEEFANDTLDPDDICPPYWHFPHIPHRGKDPQPPPDPRFTPELMGSLAANPSPDPWLEFAPTAVREIALAVAIRDLANVTSIEAASSALKAIGEHVMKEASSRVFDDYCATPVKPHIPGPPKQAVAA